MAADGGRGDVQFFSGARETVVARRSLESTQRIKRRQAAHGGEPWLSAATFEPCLRRHSVALARGRSQGLGDGGIKMVSGGAYGLARLATHESNLLYGTLCPVNVLLFDHWAVLHLGGAWLLMAGVAPA